MDREYNPRKARTKRPLPIWVDAFLRDTLHMSAEQIGAYNLLLWAMWSRETCDLPADDELLARVCRVTKHKWQKHLKKNLSQFFEKNDLFWSHKRLKKEAAYIETSLSKQSKRKIGKKSAKALNNNNATQTTDVSTDVSTDITTDITTDVSTEEPEGNPRIIPGQSYPTTQPISSSSSSNAQGREKEFLFEVMASVGLKDARIPTYWMPPAAIMHVNRWITDLGLTHDEVLDVARTSRQQHDLAPAGPKALDRAMQLLAAQKSAPEMQIPKDKPNGKPARTDSDLRNIADAARAR